MMSTITDISAQVPAGMTSTTRPQQDSAAANNQQESVDNILQGKAVAASGNVSPSDNSNTTDNSSFGSKNEMDKAVNEFVQKAQNISRDLEFRVDDELGRTVITVYDSETEEVIRQIPAEEVLELARSFKRASEGMLLKVKV